MKTDEQLEAEVIVQTVRSAISQLKARLQQAYERAYPDLIEIIQIVLDEEEANAWDLSPFPHLFLPDLVQAHLVKLNLQSADTKQRRCFGAAQFHPNRNPSSCLRIRWSIK